MVFFKYVLYDENLDAFVVHLLVQERLYTLNWNIRHD